MDVFFLRFFFSSPFVNCLNFALYVGIVDVFVVVVVVVVVFVISSFRETLFGIM